MCYHSDFLLSDETFGSSTGHHDWENVVQCGSKYYESGWIFNGSPNKNTGKYPGSNHAIYRRNGQYYYTDLDNALICLRRSPTLRSEDSFLLHNNLGGSFYQGAVWDQEYLYFIPYAGDGSYRLLRCSLDNGTVTQLGAITFTKSPSPDGAYAANHAQIGLRYNESTQQMEVVSSTRRASVARFSRPPSLSAWEARTTGAYEIAGLAADQATAGILRNNSRYTDATDPALTLWAAYYRGGKMTAVRSCSVP